MSSNHSLCPDSESVKRLVLEAGAVAVGIADADRLPERETEGYARWIADGCNGAMEYLDRYEEVRSDPRMLLEGARSIVVAAFPYAGSVEMPTKGGLRWARYALGDDYHEVLRRRLEEVAGKMEGDTRVCVDTAPLRERLWAVKAGVGFIGLNNQLIVPGVGSYVLLAEIVTTIHLTPDNPSTGTCIHCGRCLYACPGEALKAMPDGRVRLDARRCLSYLTIERRNDEVINLPKNRIYGCDTCQSVCPHNFEAPLPLPLHEFEPREEILSLTREDLLAMTQEEFSKIFRHSAIKRVKLSGLKRNASGLEG